jgi:hypothetical protein
LFSPREEIKYLLLPKKYGEFHIHFRIHYRSGNEQLSPCDEQTFLFPPENTVVREEDISAREENTVVREENSVTREENSVTREEDISAQPEGTVARDYRDRHKDRNI